ncbi:hypothetical protein FHS95_004119 [Sphingomonas naasensis]|uniref:Uncharacterized protein n=1 Tax=Sphingomonas naasensis TaxID=1344951 RepID=A0A4S1WI85_9SPHN|nr:hypothetical protein [Sphingomonas naasensis]NIJ22404.1 hypothetical protein [Sphingomonas naasensis]TGX40606.1 hypothetical protein E5A74_13930 [Sphingomonas naasensis]
MESNESYYRRRAIQEIVAARNAITADAKARRRLLAESYVRRLSELTGADESFMLDANPVRLQEVA